MPSIFDFLFGGQQAYNPAGGATPPFSPNAQQASPSILDSPEYGRQRQNDALQGMAMALIQAGAPSAQPRGFLDAFGAAGAGAMQGQQGSEDRFLKRTMINSQVRKNEQELANDKAWRDMFNGAGVTPDTSPTQVAAPSATPGDVGSRISGVESGGKYDALGPETGKGRAYGKYQVMDFNIGPWTQEVLGKSMTPQEFLANPQAQDAVFQTKFGQLAQKHGEAGARRAWFAGEGGMNNPNAADVNGMTVARYEQKTAPQVAQGDGSGNPVQPPVQQAQYQPPQMRTMQEVVASVPPGVRQMIGAMGRKEGMGVLMKYADPGSSPAIDTQSGQVVFVPNTVIGRDPRFQPVQGAELDIKRQQLANDQRKTDITERNADVTIGNDGRPVVNQTAVDAKTAVSRAQGTDPSSKITVELAQDGIKRNSQWQESALKAQSSIGRLGALQTMLDQISTNKFKGTTTQLKAAAKAAGIDLDAMGIKDDVGVTQAAEALTNMLALENRDPSGGAGMPGAMSDADREFLKQAGPSITGDPAGNKIKIAIRKGDLQRQVDIAKFSREYIKSQAFKENPAGLDDYVSERIAGKSYYDPKILQVQKDKTDDYLTGAPSPPAGFSVPGQAAPSGVPAPPAGFKVVPR